MNEIGIGTRVLNFVIDTVLIFFAAYGLYKWWTFYVEYWDYKYFAFYQFFFATIFVYYSIFEIIWSRTPAKWFTMTRVRKVEGGKPAFYQILLRSAIRLTLILDFVFIAFRERPLHDIASKTRLVEV